MVRCQNCGTENLEGAVFCKKCGARVIAPVQVPIPPKVKKGPSHVGGIIALIILIIVISVPVWYFFLRPSPSASLTVTHEPAGMGASLLDITLEVNNPTDKPLEISSVRLKWISGLIMESFIDYSGNKLKTTKIPAGGKQIVLETSLIQDALAPIDAIVYTNQGKLEARWEP